MKKLSQTDIEVRQLSPTDTQSLKAFVRLERQLLGAYPLFIAETESELLKLLSGNSPFYSEMQHALFVAADSEGEKARCVAFINGKHQAAKGEAVGFIGYFAAAPNAEPHVQALFAQAEAWLKARKVIRVIAPFNGAALLGMGLLTAELEALPMFPDKWHPPYYDAYFRQLGYEPTYPLWHYTISFASDKYRAAVQSALTHDVAHIRPIDKRNWDSEMETYRQIFNEGFREEWEFYPYTQAEFSDFTKDFKPILSEDQVLLAEVDGQTVGFCLGMPDLNPLFHAFKGKLGPWQIIRLLIGTKRYRRAGLLAIGVLPAFKGTGVAQALAVRLYQGYEKRGLTEAFYYPVNASNLRSRRFAESLGGTGRVLRHCYDKQLGIE